MSNADNKKTPLLFIASLALNIFLVAFLLGQMSMGFGHHHDFKMPPPAGHENGEFSSMAKNPPFHMTQWLFSQQELMQDEPFVQAQFDKISELRHQFAQALAQGNAAPPLTRKYFVDVDAAMAEIRNHFHQKIVERIDAMTPEERQQFAKKLMEP